MQKDVGVFGPAQSNSTRQSYTTADPKGEFYAELRSAVRIEEDTVREEWRELSSTESPLRCSSYCIWTMMAARRG